MTSPLASRTPSTAFPSADTRTSATSCEFVAGPGSEDGRGEMPYGLRPQDGAVGGGGGGAGVGDGPHAASHDRPRPRLALHAAQDVV